MMCTVCSGTGWMAYPHPDDDGGFSATAYQACPECIAESNCPACGQGMMEWGALLICVRCGFTFDEAQEPATDLTKGMHDELSAYEEVKDFVCPAEFWPALGYEGNARFVAIWWENVGDEASWHDGLSGFVGAEWAAYLALIDHNFAPTDPHHLLLGGSENEATFKLIIDRETERAWFVPADETGVLLRKQHTALELAKSGEGAVVVEDWDTLLQCLRAGWRVEAQDSVFVEQEMEMSMRQYEALMAALVARPRRWGTDTDSHSGNAAGYPNR